MSNKLTISTFNNQISVIDPSIAVTVEESLLDTRSLLQKKLKEQLELPSAEVDKSLVNNLISGLLADFARNDAELSENTLKTLFIYWNTFEQWCDKRNYVSLPASANTFLEYIEDKKSSAKMNSLSQYRWAVGKIHLAAGLPSPAHSQTVIDVMKGIKKNRARSGSLAEQASPFRSNHLDELIILWNKSSSSVECRNLAIMITAYESMLRESELARIKILDLKFTTDGRATLTIPFTKTNVSGEPDVVMLSRQCVEMIERYLSHNLNDSVYLFKKMTKNGSPAVQTAAISRSTIHRVFVLAYDTFLAQQGSIVEVEKLKAWSGHSARVGACQDLLTAGYSVLEVQQSGRWSTSEMVYLYGRDILAKDSAMAKARWSK